MGLALLIIIVVVCIFLEGFFSGSELGLVVADKIRIRNSAEQGDHKAKLTKKLLDNPRRFFSTTLLGTNICTVTATTVLTYYIIREYGEGYSIFALLISPAILVFGEVLPKSIFQYHADYMANRAGSILWWASVVFFPFVWLLSKLTTLLLGRVEKIALAEPEISREELALILTSNEAAKSDMPLKERKMIKSVFELSDDEVENIMIPIVDVEMLPVDSDIESALAIFDLKGFSRLPIFEHRSHNIVGIVDVADCLFATDKKMLREIMQEVTYVPESMPLYELYETLQDEKEEVAVVVDEYGGATGLVTLEDLLEEIVGEIRDEYELGHQHYRIVEKDHFLVSGRIEIEEANEKLGLEIEYGDYETLAGYLLELFEYIPEVGEVSNDDKWSYEIKQASARAILEVEIRRFKSEDL